MFLAVGHQGQRIISENGSDWSHLQLGKEGEVYKGAALGNGKLVAAGTYGTNNVLASSADGVAWKTFFKDGKYKLKLAGVCFGNGQFAHMR